MELFFKLTTRRNLAIGIIIFLVVMAALATLVDWQSVFAMLAAADPRQLAAATILLVIGYLAYAERWRYLLGDRPAYSATFHTANVGTMVNTLLPGRPGDAIRIVLLSQRTGIPVFAVTSSVVVERWYEQIMRLAAIGGALVFGAGAQVSAITMLGSLAYLIGSLGLMVFMLRRKDWILLKAPPLIARLPRIHEDHSRRWLSDLIDGLARISSPRRLLTILIWSIITWGFFWGFHFLCLAAIHPTLETNQLLAISLASLALVPPSASTLPGVFQVSMVVPLTLVGYDSTMLTSYSLVLNIVEMAVILIFGVVGAVSSGLTIVQLVERAREGLEEEIEAMST